MTAAEALAELGVRDDTLTAEEKATLDRDGYLPLIGVLTPAMADCFRARLDELMREEGTSAASEFQGEAGTDRLANLADKDPMFALCFTHPRVLAAIRHVLGDEFKLSSLNSRAALPGQGLQGLHADWGKAVEPGDYSVCNSIWLLDDFTADNGATRVVPGSHRSGKRPSDVMLNPSDAHPDEELLIAPKGTVVFNSHTWHGGTLNRTDKPRPAMHSYFTRRNLPQQTDQRKWISAETYGRLSPAARWVLDIE